jgi:probable phosphoglycerate mutase
VNRVFLVRHGENPANVTKEFSCRKVNHPLTARGRLQAQQTAEWFSRIKLDEVWSSPLRRALETADQIVRFHPATVTLLEDFREMDVGDLEGMEPVEGAWDLYRGVLKEWLAGNPDAQFPGGESRRTLVGRFRRGLDQITKAKNGKTILVVGHGGIFTHGVAQLCGIADQKAFLSRENYNCSVSEVEVHREATGLRFVLRAWGEIGHLSGEAAQFIESVPVGSRAKNL